MLKYSEQIYTDFLGKEIEITVDFFDLGEDGIELYCVRITDCKVEEDIDISPVILEFGDEIIDLMNEARDEDY